MCVYIHLYILYIFYIYLWSLISPNKMNSKTHNEANYNQTFENKRQRENPKSSRNEVTHHTQGNNLHKIGRFLIRDWRAEGSRLIYSKWLKKKQNTSITKNPILWQKLSFKVKNIKTFPALVFFVFIFVFVVLEIKSRASLVLGKCSTTEQPAQLNWT